MTYSNGQWLLALVVGWILLIGPGTLEGNVFPAAAPMELLRIAPTNSNDVAKIEIEPDGNYSAIWLKSARLRPNCSFSRIEWYLGKRGGQHVPVFFLLGPPKLRANDIFTAGPWIVKIPEHQFLDTYADVLHECTFLGVKLPWRVRSKFWN